MQNRPFSPIYGRFKCVERGKDRTKCVESGGLVLFLRRFDSLGGCFLSESDLFDRTKKGKKWVLVLSKGALLYSYQANKNASTEMNAAKRARPL